MKRLIPLLIAAMFVPTFVGCSDDDHDRYERREVRRDDYRDRDIDRDHYRDRDRDYDRDDRR